LRAQTESNRPLSARPAPLATWQREVHRTHWYRRLARLQPC